MVVTSLQYHSPLLGVTKPHNSLGTCSHRHSNNPVRPLIRNEPWERENCRHSSDVDPSWGQACPTPFLFPMAGPVAGGRAVRGTWTWDTPVTLTSQPHTYWTFMFRERPLLRVSITKQNNKESFHSLLLKSSREKYDTGVFAD